MAALTKSKIFVPIVSLESMAACVGGDAKRIENTKAWTRNSKQLLLSTGVPSPDKFVRENLDEKSKLLKVQVTQSDRAKKTANSCVAA